MQKKKLKNHMNIFDTYEIALTDNLQQVENHRLQGTFPAIL